MSVRVRVLQCVYPYCMTCWCKSKCEFMAVVWITTCTHNFLQLTRHQEPMLTLAVTLCTRCCSRNWKRKNMRLFACKRRMLPCNNRSPFFKNPTLIFRRLILTRLPIFLVFKERIVVSRRRWGSCSPEENNNLSLVQTQTLISGWSATMKCIWLTNFWEWVPMEV